MAFTWGERRRFIIIASATALLLAIIAIITIAVVYDPPTCMDQKQNQDETGVDCGGSCAYLCTASLAAPRVLFTRAVSPSGGRTDAIASIENPNRGAAAKDAHFTVELYGADNALIAKKEGKTDLPPGTSVPVFLSGLFSGYQTATRAFLSFDETSLRWYQYEDDRVIPSASDIELLLGDAPRVSASLTNPSAVTLRNVKAVATVFDSAGNAIAASETVASEIPPHGKASIIFTWPKAFDGEAVRVQVTPVIPLPGL